MLGHPPAVVLKPLPLAQQEDPSTPGILLEPRAPGGSPALPVTHATSLARPHTPHLRGACTRASAFSRRRLFRAGVHPAQAPPPAACPALLPSPCGGAGPGSLCGGRLVVGPPSWLLGGRGRAACPCLMVLHTWPTGDLPAAGEAVRDVRGAGGRRPAALPAPCALRALCGQCPRVRLLHRPAPALVTAASCTSWCHRRRDPSPARPTHGLRLFLADPDTPRGVRQGDPSGSVVLTPL